MTVRLYDYWRSSACYRVRIALNLKNVRYSTAPVDLMAKQQCSSEHLARNPQGLVPALEIDGLMLTQSVAIIEYLDATHPSPALLPQDPASRAHVRTLALSVACEIHPLCNSSTLARIEALAGQPAGEEWNRDHIARGLTAFEALLDHPGFTGDFCHGDQPGMADCLLIPQLYNATRWGVEFNHLRRVSAVAANCAAISAFTAARPENVRPEQKTKGRIT